MLETILIDDGHRLRSAAEAMIRTIYKKTYDADLAAFPPRLMAHLGTDGEICCIAGLRYEEDGFFSERYLDAPIEKLLGEAAGRPVSRGDIFEVTTLASHSPRATIAFLAAIAARGEADGFLWSFFTLTRRLSALVQRLGVAPLFLADADPSRIPDVARWGSYYTCSPKVYAAPSARIDQNRDLNRGIWRYANAV